MVLRQEMSVTRDMFLRTAIIRNSEFREKRVNHILKVGYMLSQVKFYSHRNYRNINRLN